jgi:hypothetical protein
MLPTVVLAREGPFNHEEKHTAVLSREFPTQSFLEQQSMRAWAYGAKFERPAPGIDGIVADRPEKIIIDQHH